MVDLVEGRTLADRIAGRPIPVAEALSIARQVAEALAAAHAHGIVVPRYFYDVSPDGQRFLVNTADEPAVSTPLTLVANWPALLKQ